MTTQTTPNLLDMINTVKTRFASLESIPLKFVEPLLLLLDNADKLTLETIAAERIKFIWIPAIHRLMDQYEYTWEQGLALGTSSHQLLAEWNDTA